MFEYKTNIYRTLLIQNPSKYNLFLNRCAWYSVCLNKVLVKNLLKKYEKWMSDRWLKIKRKVVGKI